ncbi:MAG TPA: TonB-dependent receptor [Chitinophagales bacterium]|nr:TonB-dependent receptor [Chitinophagales bacterium]
MKNRKGSWLALFFTLLLFPAFAQEYGTIKVMNVETQQPIDDAIIILQSLSKKPDKKQLIIFTNKNGEAINTYPEKAIVYIQLFGYQTFQDTILPGISYSFYLQKLTVDLNEVVVTGQYDINTSDKSVYSVKVIDGAAIQSMAAQDLGDVLSNQLNCRLSQDNILGSSVSINGISGQNVKILIDGVNVIGRENGNIDLNQINMNNVERIEIIEGPMSVSYGTDAIGGLINIVTRKSSSYPLEADLNLYYESVGTYNGDAALLWRKNNNSISLTGGRDFFDGFSQADTSRFMEWKPKEQYFASFNYNYLGKSMKAGFKSDYLDQKIQNKGNPVLTPYQAYAFDDYYLTRRWNNALTNEWRLKNNAKLQLTNAYSYYRHIRNTYRMDLVTLEQSLLTGEETQDTAVFTSWSLRGTYSNSLPVRKLNYQAGYDINLEKGKGAKLLDGQQQINDYALFGSLEYQVFKDFYVRPGLRFSYNTRYGAPVTPSLNLKYDFRANYSVRASYAHGFRAPTLKELDLYFVDVNHNVLGNNNLLAETSDNFAVSFTAGNQAGVFKLKTEVSAFYNDIHNIITLALLEPATQLYTYVNIDRYRTTGGTFSASLKSTHFSFTTGFSLTGLFNSLSDSFDIDKFSMTPEFQNNFVVTFPKAGLEGAFYLKNTGTTPGFNIDADGAVYQTFIEPYTIIDLSLTKYVMKKHMAFSLGVKNLLNVVDIQSNSLGGSIHSSGGESIPYSVGRFVFGSVRLKLYKE